MPRADVYGPVCASASNREKMADETFGRHLGGVGDPRYAHPAEAGQVVLREVLCAADHQSYS